MTNDRMQTIEGDMVDCLLSSFEYNRDNDYMIKVYYEILKRINKTHYPTTERTDEADIIYGFLVIAFGEYGTSPRSGWFNSNYVEYELTQKFNDRIKQLNSEKEM